jgi:hypothetical protein
MQVLADPARSTRLRTTAAALLTCVLALTFVAAAQRNHPHKHAPRATAVVSVSAADTFHLTPRADPHAAVGTTPAILAALIAWPATADSSEETSAHTANSPSVRGPPVEAFA